MQNLDNFKCYCRGRKEQLLSLASTKHISAVRHRAMVSWATLTSTTVHAHAKINLFAHSRLLIWLICVYERDPAWSSCSGQSWQGHPIISSSFYFWLNDSYDEQPHLHCVLFCVAVNTCLAWLHKRPALACMQSQLDSKRAFVVTSGNLGARLWCKVSQAGSDNNLLFQSQETPCF